MKKESIKIIWPVALYILIVSIIYAYDKTSFIFGSGLWSNTFNIFWSFVLITTLISLLLQLKFKSLSFLCLIQLSLLTLAPIYNFEVYFSFLVLDMKMSNTSSYVVSLLIYIIAISFVAFGLTKRAKELSAIILVVAISLSPLAYTQAMKYKLNSNKALQSDTKRHASFVALRYNATKTTNLFVQLS